MKIVLGRMTKCTFHKFGTSGNIEKHDALCILPLNIGEISVFCFFCILPLNIGDISSRSDCIVFLYPRTMSKKAARPFCILPANIGYCQRNDPLNGITFFAVNEKIYISILTFFLFPFSSHLHFQNRDVDTYPWSNAARRCGSWGFDIF